MQGEDWVKFVDSCERCESEKGPFGGVYARGKRMAVCLKCYEEISANPVAYREQVERYRRKGL